MKSVCSKERKKIMFSKRILIISGLVLLCVCVLFASCATPKTEEDQTGTPTATAEATPEPTIEPTPEPLPEIGELNAVWDDATGMVLTWTPFEGDFECTLQRKDTSEEDFADIGDADSAFGTFTDTEPGEAGMSPVYRLRVSDGEREVYSGEASVMIPFIFGSTGGNLANGGIACEQGETICRMDLLDGAIGVYAWETEGEKRLLVDGMASQLNISNGYLYYLYDINNRNRSGIALPYRYGRIRRA